MAAFSFQRRFVEPILAGTKTGTIRRERKGGWRPRVGMELQLYYGLRTRRAQMIGRATCAGVVSITIDLAACVIFLAGDVVGISEGSRLDAFARSDGFKSWPDMYHFWKVEHEDARVFSGFHTTWINLQPTWRTDNA